MHQFHLVRFVRYTQSKLDTCCRSCYAPANHFEMSVRGSKGKRVVGQQRERGGYCRQTGITFDTGDNVAQLNLDAVFCLHAINIMRVFPICHADQKNLQAMPLYHSMAVCLPPVPIPPLPLLSLSRAAHSASITSALRSLT